MKLRKIILICFAAILLSRTNSFCQPNQSPPPGFTTRLDYLKSLTNEAAITAAYQKGLISDDEQMEAISIEVSNRHYTSMADVDRDYHRGLIGKEEAMMAMETLADKLESKPMDIYGKVIDQNGQPVVNAKVRGALRFESPGSYEDHFTQTDAQGQFHFLGLKGKDLGIFPEKEEYEFNPAYKFAVNRPNNYLPDPNDPFIVHMWKLRGAEPMVHADTKNYPGVFSSLLKPNGDVARINLMTCLYAEYFFGKNFGDNPRFSSDEHHYDLEVELHLDELIRTNANRVLFCNWSATIGITNGGLIEISTNNAYPYEAPAEGYQPSITLDFPTNMVGWTDQFEKRFYFKSENGKTYGRMTIKMNNRGRSFDLEVYANPNGSRNLEFDPKKRIFANGRKAP